MENTGNAVVRCPDCSSTEISGPDSEGLIDCCGCGIWFNPNHPNNTRCFGDLNPRPVSQESA